MINSDMTAQARGLNHATHRTTRLTVARRSQPPHDRRLTGPATAAGPDRHARGRLPVQPAPTCD